jgi:cysteinyl-tRNA synthetase
MDDDFNTGAAVGVLFDLLGSLNRMADQADLEGKGKGDAAAQGVFHLGVRILRELAGVLGVFRDAPVQQAAADDQVVAKLVELAIDVRAMAREQKQFELADTVRDRLGEMGITLEDRPDGTTWRWE